MKKKLIILTAIILLTGCSKNKLTCTSKETVKDNSYDTTVTFNFKKDKIEKYNIKMSVVLNGSSMENYSLYLNAFKDTFKEYDSREGVSYKIEENDSGYILNLTADLNKLKDAIPLFNKTLNLKDTKAYYEGIGYTCK